MAFRYSNQGAPFWDFVASLDDLGPGQELPRERPAPTEPFGWGWAPHQWQHAGPSRGHHGHHLGPPPPHRGHHHGPPPHHEHRGPSPPPHHGPGSEHHGRQSPPPPPPAPGHAGPEHGPHGGEEHRGPPPPFPHGPHAHRPHPRHHEGPARGRGCRGRGGFGRHGGPHQQNPIFNPLGGLSDLFSSLEPALASLLEPHDQAARNRAQAANETDFTPSADVFATPEEYVVHIPLPGAQKSDIGISYLQATNTLTVSGVVHRPGDEALLSTMASGERKDIGVFEKKIKLGGEGEVVDEEGIRAKLEDGILRVRVPKAEKKEPEKKKVEIEQVREMQEALEKEDFELDEKETLFDVEEVVDEKTDEAGGQKREAEKEEEKREEKTQSPVDNKQKYQVSLEDESEDDDFVDLKKVDLQ